MNKAILPSVILAAAALCAVGAVSPLAAADPVGRERVLEYLEKIRASQTGMMNVAPAEGRYLSELVKKLNAKRVLEIGTSNGYSGIWLALGLRETGGKLITLEIDTTRRSLALENFRAAGMDSIIDSRLADALEVIPTLEGPFDLVFIDAWKPDYHRYLTLTLPKVRPGGAVAAHNVISHPRRMRDFLDAISSNPALRTEIVREGPSGLSVSYKK